MQVVLCNLQYINSQINTWIKKGNTVVDDPNKYQMKKYTESHINDIYTMMIYIYIPPGYIIYIYI